MRDDISPEALCRMLERPALTAAIIGAPATITIHPQALKALATYIRALNGTASDNLSKEQIANAMRLILGGVSLWKLVQLWFMLRAVHWARRA